MGSVYKALVIAHKALVDAPFVGPVGTLPGFEL